MRSAPGANPLPPVSITRCGNAFGHRLPVGGSICSIFRNCGGKKFIMPLRRSNVYTPIFCSNRAGRRAIFSRVGFVKMLKNIQRRK